MDCFNASQRTTTINHPDRMKTISTPEQRKQWKEWRQREEQEIEDAKILLAAEYGLERNAKFDKAWAIAWSLGHSSGIGEVKNYFHELAPLLEP